MNYFDEYAVSKLKTQKTERWIQDHCVGKPETHWANGLQYMFCQMNDGWIAIFRLEDGILTPLIQAKGKEHAEGYVGLIEPVNVPFDIFE